MTIGRSAAIINMTSVCLSTTVYDRQDLHKEEMQTVGEGDGLDQSLGELFHYADLQAVSTRRYVPPNLQLRIIIMRFELIVQFVGLSLSDFLH